MNPTKIKNDKASRSLKAILAGADEECAKTNESVACGDGEKQEIEKEVTDAPSDAEVTEDKEPAVPAEEVESGKKDEEEPEEISEEDEEPELDEEIKDDEVVEDEEEPEEITDDEVEAAKKDAKDEDEVEEDEDSEDEDEEPIAEEEIEEITEDEVQAARKAKEEDDEEPEEITDDEDMSVEDVMDEDTSDDEELDEEEEESDEDSTTEAVAMLVKKGFNCSIDNKGKIVVSGCEKTEACDCGDENCPECKEEKEEEASVTLRPVDAEEKVDAEAVQTVLTGAESESPFYTVLIKGMPVATIALADQPNAEAIRAYFLSNKYPSKLATAMAMSGVKNVLDTQHAKMFTAAVNKTEVAQAMKAEAKADFDKQMSEAIIAMKDKFVSAVKLAVAGMNKNFFTEPNDLKGAAYAAFSSLGHDENIANEKTEAIIAQADSFFDTAIAKATELMGKSDEAFAEISDMIAKAGVATRTVKTFASALEQGNNPVIASVMKQDEEVKPTQTTASALLHGRKLFGRR